MYICCISISFRGVAQPGSASGLGPEGRRFKSCRPDHCYEKKAIIYKPSKTAMQSGYNNTKKWILEFITENAPENPLMGWESSTDTSSEIILNFHLKKMQLLMLKKSY